MARAAIHYFMGLLYAALIGDKPPKTVNVISVVRQRYPKRPGNLPIYLDDANVENHKQHR